MSHQDTELLSERTRTVFEGSAQAFPPVPITQDDFADIISDAWSRLSRNHRLDLPVKEYLMQVLLQHQNPKNSVFSVRLYHPENRHGIKTEREFVLPVQPFDKKTESETDRRIRLHIPDTPQLHIHDAQKFILKLHAFFRTGMKEYDYIVPWFHEPNGELIIKSLDSLWYHATPWDFQHPEAFIDRVQHHITQRPFENLARRPISLPTKTLNGSLIISHRISARDMEAPFELVPVVVPENNRNFAPAGTLPVIRYGIDGTSVYIYAAQMPKAHVPNHESVLEAGEENTEYARLSMEYFQGIQEKFPGDFERIFGKIPEELFKTNDPERFVTKFMAYLNTTFPDLYSGKYKYYGDWIRARDGQKFTTFEAFRTSIQFALDNELRDLKFRAKAIAAYPDYIQNPKKRDKLMRTLYQLDRTLPPDPEYEAYERERRQNNGPGTLPEYPEENIHDVFRPAVISLSVALEMFRKAGMKEIIVPTYFPLRWQDHLRKAKRSKEPERIQDVTSNRLVRLFRRMEVQVHGIQITQLPHDDGFMRLRFTDPVNPLTSDTPILGELLDNLGKTDVPIKKQV